jgi:diphthamide biosynthesis protein 7
MHAGSRVMRLCKGSDGLWMFEVLARFEEHRSMNYGSDVQPTDAKLKSIVSTSFYDKLLCLWQYDISNMGEP